MKNSISINDYLCFISAKYNVDIDSLFNGLVNARQNNAVSCGKLMIQCRQKSKDYDVFLITKGYQVVAQFFIPKYFLDQPNQVKELELAHMFKKLSKRSVGENPKNIADLRYGMKRIKIRARVIDKPKSTLVFTRFGQYAHVSNALIADETGSIKLCLWNEKIREISINSVVQIENASITKFRGENQVRLGKTGRLSVIENAEFPSLREIKRILLKSPA
jgi:hypothetical protein